MVLFWTIGGVIVGSRAPADTTPYSAECEVAIVRITRLYVLPCSRILAELSETRQMIWDPGGRIRK